jgi:coenzyme F420 hydrogenase subunit beta
VCPSNAISMKETPGGLLQAEVCEDLCTHCGLCLKVCPGDHLQPDLLSSEVDPFKGPLRKVYYGKSSNPKHLRNGQSGGVATTLLCWLLDQKYIDKALVTQMPNDGTLRPVSMWAKSEKDIVRSQGSKYCPVALNEVLPNGKEIMSSRYALVGLPCHIHGVKNILDIKRSKSRPLLIGLVCDRVMSYGALDYMICKAGIKRLDVRSFRFRNKKFGGWPGDIGIQKYDQNIFRLSSKHRQWCKGFFTPLRCYLCFDKMNYFADIVLGDAWGVEEVKEGSSVIIARTSRGKDVIEKAMLNGILVGDTIDPERVFSGQHIKLKRKNWTSSTTVWQQQGNSIPDFGIKQSWYSAITNGDKKVFAKKIRIACYLPNVRLRKVMLKKAMLKYSFGQIKRQLVSLFKKIW